MVSVIIPVYNGARFLDQCLASVAAQALPPDEVIVVDDGSTDDSADIARRHAGVQVIGFDENRGPSAARNAGVAAARGDVLVFHDADDVMPPARLATQLAHLAARPEVDVVLGRQRHLLEEGSEFPVWARPNHAAPDALRVTLGHPTMRRATFERLGGYDESFRVAEDIDLLYRCRDLGAIISILDSVAVLRRLHDANATHGAVESGLGTREQLRSVRAVARRRREREVPVSAILAVRDGAQFVAEAVKSILGQTRVPAEIIVVDDGSVDATPEILGAFGARITVERIEPSGPARARNHALARATQPLVAFCDADDLWLPEKTELQTRALTARPDDGGIEGAEDLAGVFSGIEEFHDTALLGDRTDQVRAPMVLTAARMAQTLLVRRADLDRVGHFDPAAAGGEFIEWLARAESRGLRFGNVPRVLSRRRIHGDNKTTDPGWTGFLATTLKQVMAHHRAAAAAGPTTEYRPEP